MALKICEHCNKAFIDGGEETGIPICPDCAEYLDEVYRAAWSWLRDRTSEDGRQRRVTAARLARAIDVDVKSIEVLVKMDRIQTSASSSGERPDKDLDTLKALRRSLSGSRYRKDRR
ncbi:MAG: hypothetical protein ACOX5A_06795 [Aminivibrio sp.]|jgi:hypothetical protein|nr:hypothetical protein [Synergistaceae bacterium]